MSHPIRNDRRSRKLRIEPLEDRRLLAALVGVDFGSGSVPVNWAQISSVGATATPTERTNLIDETGAATAIDLTISTTFAGGATSTLANITPTTLPLHTQSLSQVSGVVFVDSLDGIHRFDAKFGDLKPGFSYEVYVFGLESAVEGTPFVDNQTVTISGGGAPIVFAQNPITGGNLWVNDQVGSSTQQLATYRKLMTPTTAGQIDVRVQMNAGSDALVLAGLAIREVGIVVNSTGDIDDLNAANGVTTLREAIRLANASAGADTITFDATVMSGATINLGGTELAISEALTIDAAPLAQNVTINAQQQSRIFNITAANGDSFMTGDFTLTGLTLTGGRTTTDNNGIPAPTTYNGGAIRSTTLGLLTLTESTISGNSTAGRFAMGGGIYAGGNVSLFKSTVSSNSTAGNNAEGGGIRASNVTLTQSTVSDNSTAGSNAFGGGVRAVGDVTISQSTVSGNSTAGSNAAGGGILSGNAVTLTQSTVSGNSTAGTGSNGGGIWAIGSFNTQNAVTLTQSTVSGNRATGPGSLGGGVFQDNLGNNFPLSFSGSIIAGNTAAGGSPDVRPDPGSVFAVNHSLIGTGVTPTAGGNNIVSNDPLLGPLADNGGPTKTHALLPGSPALDAGPTPAAFYRFEEGAGASTTASLVNIQTANLLGGVTMGQSGAPQVGGNAATFDGVNDYMHNPSSFNLGATNRYSVELWFNATSLGSGDGQTLVALTNGVGGHAALVELSAGGALRFLNRIPAGNEGGDNLTSAVGTVTANQWNHLAAVRDGSNMRIYLNGVQVAALDNATTSNLPSSLLLTVGRLSESQSDRYFGGKIDELVLHTRALTPSEVALHAQAGLVDQRGSFGFSSGGAPFPFPDIGAYESQGIPGWPVGDYNHNGIADTADYTVWRDSLGQTGVGLPANGDNSGASANKIDQADYLVWRNNFGNTVVPASSAAVSAAIPVAIPTSAATVTSGTNTARREALAPSPARRTELLLAARQAVFAELGEEVSATRPRMNNSRASTLRGERGVGEPLGTLRNGHRELNKGAGL